ncbi:MAG: bifunctional [glutamate--ammonia ligase]-adenylyl-L-tyrosine phosphorylase/[glutamate--ammonia-ligase] adenylyltransferase [Actinomycetota bacterium]
MPLDILLKETSIQTPDPERSFKNLERLLKAAPAILKEHSSQIKNIAELFSYSQFLADYSINNPAKLSHALKSLYIPVSKQIIVKEAKNKSVPLTKQEVIKFLRELKKDYLLRITLRDIMRVTSLNECMSELSSLAEAIVELALEASFALMKERYGEIKDNPFSIIALGKLGAGELNYSSDIDIITVYGSYEGISTGVLSPSGIRINKTSSHEYFCRLTELLTALIQTQTEDGIAYRVDLRLRPDGRKGELSLSLDSYMSYYESWGRTWERMALMRARPIAGDIKLGKRLLSVIEPFIWKKTVDFYDIDEIKELKRKLDAVSNANNIKRGPGGIREIEFFVQTFQLLYGGEKKQLRTGKLELALKELQKEGLLPKDDARFLAESYQFLRRIEHVLQMRDDLQVHVLPVKPKNVEILAKKMRFSAVDGFKSELKLRRLKVGDMYNSLLGSDDGKQSVMIFFEDELTDDEIMDYLVFKGFKDTKQGLRNIKAINEQMVIGRTIRERSLLRKIVPIFIGQVFKVGNKDRVLSAFVTFLKKIAGHESYLSLFLSRSDIVELIIRTFSKSTYLTRSLLSLENLESIFEYPDARMDYKSVAERLLNTLQYSQDPMAAVREFRIIEEMRSAFLFLEGVLDIDGFTSSLSMIANIIVRTLFNHLGGDAELAVVSLGKFGSNELSVGSDLDLIFISGKEKSVRLAEELIKYLSEYTSRGIVYEVDMRLRPDGSKGPLVNTIDGYENYYHKSAHPWEIQALLKARSSAGNGKLLREFLRMKRRVIVQRGREIKGSYVKDIRRRIINEVSRESAGYDIKLGPGGIEEIEFLVQYLQLKHASDYPDLITRKTTTAIERLAKHGIIDSKDKELLLDAYRFMRTVETLLRLNEEKVLKVGSELADVIVDFLSLKDRDELIGRVEGARKSVVELAERLCFEK